MGEWEHGFFSLTAVGKSKFLLYAQYNAKRTFHKVSLAQKVFVTMNELNRDDAGCNNHFVTIGKCDHFFNTVHIEMKNTCEED